MDDLLPISTPLKTETQDEKMHTSEEDHFSDSEMATDIQMSEQNIKTDIEMNIDLIKPAVLNVDALANTKTAKKKKGKPIPVIGEKSGKKGKPIPGMAREIVLKVAEVCEQEHKDGCSRYPTNAPTKRASVYTGVSVSTIRRIRAENSNKNNTENAGDDNKNDVKDKMKKEIGRDKEDFASRDKKDQKRSTIPNSAREIISKVIVACDKEAHEGNFLIPFISKTKRVALYTGISESTIKRIKIEDRVRNKVNPGKTLPRPGNIRKRATCDEKLDDFDLQVIRREIDDYTLVKKTHLSIATLLSSIKEKINVNFCKGTLWRLLKKKGYEFRRFPGEKSKTGKIITEKPEISEARLNFLKEITKHEAEGRVIVYLDDVTFQTNDTEDDQSNSDLAKRALSINDKILCSERIIRLHDHSVEQFAKKIQVLFKPNSINTVMAPRTKCNVTVEYAENWFKANIFTTIPANSVIVMSTPPKEKKDKEKIPTKLASKLAMLDYLKNKNYPYDHSQSKEQLYKIIKKNAGNNGRLETRQLDKIIRDNGHTPLRLSECLSEFHPLSLAWTDLKRFIRNKQNPKSRLSSEALRSATYEAITYFTQETWQGYVTHIIDMENYYWEKRLLFQEHISEIRKWAVEEANLKDGIPGAKNEKATETEINTESPDNNNKLKTKKPVKKNFATQTEPNDFKLLGIPNDAIIIENLSTNTISIQTQTPNGLPNTIANVSIAPPNVVSTQTNNSGNIQKPYEGIPMDNYYFNSWYNRHVTDVAGTSQPTTVTPVSIDPRQIDNQGANYQKTWIDLCTMGYDASKSTIQNSGAPIQNTVSGHLTNL